VIDHRGDLVILELLGEGRHREGYTTSAMAFPCRPQSAARSLRIRIVLVRLAVIPSRDSMGPMELCVPFSETWWTKRP